MVDIETEPFEEIEKDYDIFKEAAERLEKRYGETSSDIVHRLKRHYVERLYSEIDHRRTMAIMVGG